MKRMLAIIGFTVFFVAAISAVALYRENILNNQTNPEIGIGGGPPTTVPTPEVDDRESRSVVDELERRGNFTIYVEALRTTGMLERLSGPEAFTIFAPTDDAFVKVNSEILYPMLTDRNSLRSLVESHIVQGELASERYIELGSQGIENLNNETLRFTDTTVSGSEISEPDIEIGNGVIHVVDDLIFPESVRETLTPATTI